MYFIGKAAEAENWFQLQHGHIKAIRVFQVFIFHVNVLYEPTK
jgi:hypothetical protein